MVSLYKDPQGEDIFKKSSAISESLGFANENKSTSNENEIRLRKKIKNLEDEMKQKDVCWQYHHSFICHYGVKLGPWCLAIVILIKRGHISN